MDNLKKLLEKVNTTNPTEFDIRIVSLKNFYISLKKEKQIKNLRRLKLLLYLYPKILEENSFRIIEGIVLNPKEKTIRIKTRNTYASYEEYAIKKRYANRPIPSGSIVFAASDLYEYFGLN